MPALNPERAQMALETAKKALKKKEARLANRFARKAAFFDPGLEEAWLIIASTSSLRRSIRYIKRALEINPQSQRARRGLSRALKEIRKEENSGISSPGSSVLPENNENQNPVLGKEKRDARWAYPLFISIVLVGMTVLCGFGLPVLNAQASSRTESRPKEALFKPSLTPTITPTPTMTPTPTPTPTPTLEPTADTYFSSYRYHSWDIPDEVAGTNTFWIEVDLTYQMLFAYRGNQLISGFYVSTGTSEHPTVTGTYKIYAKFPEYTMVGPGYDLADVPYSMFFHKGYSIHGTYWHNNFGVPMSHGCVNMNTNDAAWVYENAPVGTYVFVHY